jgi:hypothetical protein
VLHAEAGKPRLGIFFAATLGLQGCFATWNTSTIGLRQETGVVTSAEDMSVAGPTLIFHGTARKTFTWGGVTFSGESTGYRVVGVARERPWWARVDREDFQRNLWSAKSLQAYQDAVPAEVLEGAVRHGAVPPAGQCYSVRVRDYGAMQLITCDGKGISATTNNDVTLRTYRAWWAYPSMIVAYPLAIPFDVVTFPVQLYAYVYWNKERTRW